MNQDVKPYFESSYHFKLIKASWGIFALIRGKVESINEPEITGEFRISNTIWFSFNGKLTAPAEDKIFMLNGIKSVCEEIESQINEPIVISLTDFQINPCDYQKEGMKYAFANWAANHFGFPPKEFNSDFDRETNKYVFSEIDQTTNE